MIRHDRAGRLAAIVFTDLVGSTALRARVGEVMADELRRAHDAALSAVVDQHGGRVVKGLGDGLMATFDSAVDAVAAAVGMQQAIEHLDRRPGVEPLHIRVAISAGEVVAEGDDLFGTPVIEAARLCAACEGDEVLVADAVRAMAGLSDDAVVLLGDLSLKGLAQPVTTWRVMWAPTEVAVELPHGLTVGQGRGFAGRGDELAVVLGAWQEAVAGDARVVAVAGEPGIGKTRLLGELARAVATQGGVVLYGRAEEGLGVPYGPFVEALEGFLASCPRASLEARLGPLGGELVRLVPTLPELVDSLAPRLRAEPSTERLRLFASVCQFLERTASDAPALVVLDDMQWADESDVLLLASLVHHVEGPVLLAFAYRDTEIDEAHPLTSLLADLPRLSCADQLHLRGLAADAVQDLVAEAAGNRHDPQVEVLSHAVLEGTAGNPFFVGEVLDELEGHGLLAADRAVPADSVMTEAGISLGVQSVVAGRLRRLPGGVIDTLETAAVIGARFDLPLLVAARGNDPETVVLSLSEAEAAGLIVPDAARPGRYVFVHTIVRDALLAGLTSSSRLVLHQQVGRALADLPDAATRLSELALHFSRAAAMGEGERAVEYGRRAAEQAEASLAFEQAALHYRGALTALELLAEDLPARFELLMALSNVLSHAGDTAHRDVVFEAAQVARRAGDPHGLARAALVGARWHRRSTPVLPTDVDEDLLSLIDEASAGLGDEPSALRAQLLTSPGLLAGLTGWLWLPRYRSGTDEGLRIARTLGDDRVLAEVLIDHRWAISDPALAAQRLAEAEEAVATCTRLGDVELLFWATRARFEARMEHGDVTGAEDDVASLGKLAAQLHEPYTAFFVAQFRVALMILHGEVAAAERAAMEVAALGRDLGAGAKLGVTHLILYQFTLRRMQGELTELRELLDDEVVRVPHAGWRGLRAYIAEAVGHREDALADVQYFAADNFASIPRDRIWTSIVAGCGEIAAHQGEFDIVQRAYDALAPLRGLVIWNLNSCNGPIDLSLGRFAGALGRDAVALNHLDNATSWCRTVNAPWFEALAELERAPVLDRLGDDDGASAARDCAATLLRRLDLPIPETAAGSRSGLQP